MRIHEREYRALMQLLNALALRDHKEAGRRAAKAALQAEARGLYSYAVFLKAESSVYFWDFDAAYRLYQDVLRDLGHSPLVLSNYAALLSRMNQMQAALEILDKVLKSNPDDPYVHTKKE